VTSEFVSPAYQERSLGDVLPAVGHAMGVDAGLPETALALPRGDRFVVFLIDGLGYDLLRDNEGRAPYLHSLLDGQPAATVGVPTTTATSLTSLGTGLPPGLHGVVGYTSRIPGTNRLLNALAWDKHIDPVVWQPHPTAFERLAGAGVRTTVVNKREFAGSGLTVAGQRGADFVGADRYGERLAAVLAASSTAPSLTYIYDGDLDWTGHRYGVDSVQWAEQLSMIDVATEHLRATLPPEVRLVVVADHGMVDSAPEDRVDIDDFPQLREGVALLGGEARLRHLYCHGRAVDDVVATWRSHLEKQASVLTRDEALALGWFGEVAADVRLRIGDVVVACHDSFAVQSRSAFPHEAKLVGLHGSLTPAEMLIPLLVT